MSLNEAQQRAVDSNNPRILCIAGAGTGKTHTMIARIARLVNEGVDPSTILALTFTNAAAFEMKDRFSKLAPSSRIPEFRTFHSFCYHLIATDTSVRMGLGYKYTPKVAEPGEVKQLLSYCLLQLGLKQTLPQLIRAATPKDKQDLEAFNKALYKEMHRKGLITFDRLCYGVGSMFVENKPYIEKYHNQYKYIFVDEFQDTDPRQWEFVSSFKDSNLFIVGDALQAIYGFRGADSSIIKSISTDPDWEVIKLYQNYRSSVEICNYANDNSKHAEDAYRVLIEGQRTGGHVEKISCRDGYKAIVDSVLMDTILSIWRNVESGTGAILCRTNAEVEAIATYFADEGVEFTRDKANDEAVHVIKSAVNPKYALDWLLTYLNAEKYAEYIRIQIIDGEDSPPAEQLSKFLARFGKARNIQDRWNLICQVRDAITASQSAIQRWESVMNVLADITSDYPVCPVMNEYITSDHLADILIEALQEEKAHNLYIGTIHSSKGLEYDTVFLVNVGGYRFKVQSEEDKNLLYVGITRAKNNLLISYCKER